jgi:hypothetical protein
VLSVVATVTATAQSSPAPTDLVIKKLWWKVSS